MIYVYIYIFIYIVFFFSIFVYTHFITEKLTVFILFYMKLEVSIVSRNIKLAFKIVV